MTDSPSSERQYNTTLGLKLFVVYTLFYLGFVLISAFAADLMETVAFAGLNLAIVYGFGLIVSAFVLALVYGVMCRSELDEGNAADCESEATDAGAGE